MDLSVSIPETLAGKVQFSSVYGNYTATGKLSSFGVSLTLEAISQYREVKSREIELLAAKVEQILKRWAELYEKHLNKVATAKTEVAVAEQNHEIAARLKALEAILAHTLQVDDRVDWESLKRVDEYSANPDDLLKGRSGTNVIEFDRRGRPKQHIQLNYPPEPSLEGVKQKSGLLRRLLSPAKIRADYEQQHIRWENVCGEADKTNRRRKTLFDELLQEWSRNKGAFDQKRAEDNEKVDAHRARYEAGDPNAVEEYCDLVLSSSNYPDEFPKDWVLEYRPDTKMVVVEYELPDPSALPDVESYRFVKSRNEVQEKKLSDSKRKKLFNSVIYQIGIRTIHELLEADVVDAIHGVGFNGIVTSVNPATGVRERKLILSVTADKAEFLQFDLSQVDPKATFKHLKGVSAANLMDLTPVPPIVQLDKSDRRFIEGREVVGSLDSSMNLAAMRWDDFEHLIRELFEKEFVSTGGEVKVTQVSADGGVDAVAFDPDPIRGGKIVIQAKRYTNTVGVAAVRDLYGTVMNEGATKGILVTTSDYGSDSYKFARDKPITLLNGGNLLSLLEKHGHRARINIEEAKKLNSG